MTQSHMTITSLDLLNSISSVTTGVWLHKCVGKWFCHLEHKLEGVEIKIEKGSDDINEVIREAVTAYTRLAEAGRPQLFGGLLTAPVEPEYTPFTEVKPVDLDDEIPF